MPSILIYSKSWCPYCDRAKSLLTSKGQVWTEVDVEANPDQLQIMLERSNGQRTVPQIFIDDNHVGGCDDLYELDRRDELDKLLSRQGLGLIEEDKAQVLIVGSGPAGYTAAIYASRADLEPVLIAGFQSGGQLMLTTDVENYPGFPESVTGPDMMEMFQKQAERFGTRVVHEDASLIDLAGPVFRVETSERVFNASSLILSTGASARWLGLPSEERLQNRGVSACATCDGALFRDKAMAVVGGGDTALEEALFLTRYATKVTVIHRRETLRASKIMQERALDHAKIEFAWNSVVEEVLGNDCVSGVRIRDTQSGKTRDLGIDALFVAIGHRPNTELLRQQLELDESGYVKVEPGTTRTSVEGVFACGDVMDPSYRQAITAAGTGCMAAIDVERWLASEGIA